MADMLSCEGAVRMLSDPTVADGDKMRLIERLLAPVDSRSPPVIRSEELVLRHLCYRLAQTSGSTGEILDGQVKGIPSSRATAHCCARTANAPVCQCADHCEKSRQLSSAFMFPPWICLSSLAAEAAHESWSSSCIQECAPSSSQVAGWNSGSVEFIFHADG